MQQTGPNGLARMDGHDTRPAVRVAKKVMAASDANDQKTALRQCGDQLGPSDPGTAAHTATVMR